MAEVFLKLENIKKSFGGVQALKGVDLEIKKGEILCLAGQNGCGKSTLIKVISGAHEQTSGDYYLEGKKVEHLKPIDAIKAGIQVIYQDFAVFPNLTVAENIAMNNSLMTGTKVMNWKNSRELALKAMEMVGAHMDPDILVERLTVANKQMVAICRAIINDAKFLILDEPTTALTKKEVENLFEIVRGLKKKGIAIMIVNHKLDEIYEIADRLTIIRNGEYVSSGDISEYDRARFIRDLTGHDIVEETYHPEKSQEEILKVENLSRQGAFENVSFTINKGDVIGVTGLLGSGRSEIGDALFGIAPADSGKVTLKGKEIQIKSIEDAIKNRIAYVPEDRLTQGLFLDRSIRDNMVAASINKYFHGGKLDFKAIADDTAKWIKEVSVKTENDLVPIRTLSGGNAQKVVIAKWLNTDPELIVLNGPTVGVDIGSKSEIFDILHDLANKGVGVVVITDDLSELVQNCNKIVVMRNGKAVAYLDQAEKHVEENEVYDIFSKEGGEE
ncbi:MAG: sugar ABC transporter ATP-binding protein [Eubacteriales bacterium]|nr:sugar ABC transporter ATP-binding protein [Eubacteriales bacterium]